MKDNLDMTYRKIHKVPVTANSVANRIMRQQCSIILFKYIKKGFRIFNLDESWVGGCNYQRRSWRKKEETNSQSSQSISPRISLILALDNHGKIYFSLTQANSNSSVMEVFILAFTDILDKEDKHWRTNTIFLWDGASYHHSA
jgi:hypothetical protein